MLSKSYSNGKKLIYFINFRIRRSNNGATFTYIKQRTNAWSLVINKQGNTDNYNRFYVVN